MMAGEVVMAMSSHIWGGSPATEQLSGGIKTVDIDGGEDSKSTPESTHSLALHLLYLQLLLSCRLKLTRQIHVRLVMGSTLLPFKREGIY